MSVPLPETSGTPDHSEKPVESASSRWRSPVVACLLSLIVPGMGQLRNREPWKGLVFAITLLLLTVLAVTSRLPLSFKGMVGFVAGTWSWKILICIDAFRIARRGTQTKKPFQQARITFLVAGLLITTCSVGPTTDYFLHKFGFFRAFRVPSSSMCPTICDGDRTVADMDAYLKTAPQRGDLIMIDFHSKHGPLFIKRIVGVGGDIVSEKDGAVLINGTPLAVPGLSPDCGRHKDESPLGEEPRFNSVTVPPESFFVVGDNSTSSFDSRMPDFGYVTPNQVKGRPIYIYWSADRSRIGCATR